MQLKYNYKFLDTQCDKSDFLLKTALLRSFSSISCLRFKGGGGGREQTKVDFRVPKRNQEVLNSPKRVPEQNQEVEIWRNGNRNRNQERNQ